MSLSRRKFIENTALTGLAAASVKADTAPKLPTRVLGKTGVRVSILGMGTGSRFLQYKEEDRAIEAVQKGLDLGITYIDTADSYGRNHLSEERVGKAIKGRRDGLFLATKLSNRNGAEAFKVIEESLKALQVDRVALTHVHQRTTEDDLAELEAKCVPLDQEMKLRPHGVRPVSSSSRRTETQIS